MCIRDSPYKYISFTTGFMDPNVVLGNVATDIRFLYPLFKAANILKSEQEILRVFGTTSKMFSDFIPIPICTSFGVKEGDDPISLFIKLGEHGSYAVRLPSFVGSNVEKWFSKMGIVDINEIVQLFKIMLSSGYRADSICMYLREESACRVNIDIEEPSYGFTMYMLRKHSDKARKRVATELSILKSFKVRIVEVKTSDPTWSRSYTPNQRKFLNEFTKLKQNSRELYEYLVVYMPLKDLLEKLRCSIYYDE